MNDLLTILLKTYLIFIFSAYCHVLFYDDGTNQPYSSVAIQCNEQEINTMIRQV